MIADRGGNQTDLVGLPAPFSGLGQDVTRGHHARRPVVITSPAETTTLRTPTRDLDQESISHFGLGGPNGCRWREDFIPLQLRNYVFLPAANRAAQTAFLGTLSRNCAADTRRNTFLSCRISLNCAVVSVTNVIERRHVETTTLSRQLKQRVFLRFVFQQHVDQLWPEDFSFADANDVSELSDGFGI